MAFKKGDFIEINFTGKTLNGEVFDSNVKEELEKLHEGHNHKVDAKPFIFPIGQSMFLKGVEEFLIGKDVGNYKIELPPEKAFGKRDSKLIQIAPSRIFKEQRVAPFPGAVFNFDGKIAKVLSVSGGRITVDFNNPLAGKDVVYEINVLRSVDDMNEKVKSVIEFLFKKDLEFEIKDKMLILKVEKPLVKFVELFKEKFKEILNLDLEVREITEESSNKKKQVKNHNNS